MQNKPEKKLVELIDRQKTVLVSSIDEQGFPNTKAMLSPRKREGLKVFYFTTNTSSMRVAQFRKNQKACIYFYDSQFFEGIMLKGIMEVLEDAEHKEMIWENGDTLYYPKGVTDPDYCVLCFTAESGRFYSNFSSEDFAV
jgi:general stress protein 26